MRRGPIAAIVDVSWTDADGTRHTGTTRLSSDQAASRQVRIRVGPDNRPVNPPRAEVGAVVTALAAGVAAALLACLPRRRRLPGWAGQGAEIGLFRRASRRCGPSRCAGSR